MTAKKEMHFQQFNGMKVEGTSYRSGATYIYHGSGLHSDTTVDQEFLSESLSAVQMNNFLYDLKTVSHS